MKLYLEQSVKTGKFYEIEMDQKDSTIKKLELAIEEYEK